MFDENASTTYNQNVPKFKYVINYGVGNKIEIPEAERLLAEYNDFYASNLAYYQNNRESTIQEDGVVVEVETDEANKEKLEKQAHDDAVAFRKSWGSLDFASATLVGLEIDWDSIQAVIINEREKDVHPSHSKLKDVAVKLRKLCSILTFSERIVTKLKSKRINNEMIDLMIKGFEVLIDQLSNQDMDMPEFEGMEKKKFVKIKTADGIMDYANSIFEIGR